MSQGPHNGLFSLPEYEYAQYMFVYEGVLRLMEAKDQLWARTGGSDHASRIFQTSLRPNEKASHAHNSRQRGGCPRFVV